MDGSVMWRPMAVKKVIQFHTNNKPKALKIENRSSPCLLSVLVLRDSAEWGETHSIESAILNGHKWCHDICPKKVFLHNYNKKI